MTTRLTPIDHNNRYNEIPDVIHRIADNNCLIHRIKDEYVSGNIVTLTEMLCQMVVYLDKDWSRMQKEAMQYYMMRGPSITISKDDLKRAGISLPSDSVK